MKMLSRVATMEEGKEEEAVRLLMVSLLLLLVGLGFCIASMFAVKYFGIQNQISVAPIAESNIRPCYIELSSVTSWIKPLSNLLHNMNDSGLFWHASIVPPIKAYPFKRVRKIAFMFFKITFMYSIYLDSHPAYAADFPPPSVFCQRQIPSKFAEWGMMTMCDAERRLLCNTLLDISNEWVILLSEQKFSVIHFYLSRSRHSFTGSFNEPGPYGRGRLEHDPRG